MNEELIEICDGTVHREMVDSVRAEMPQEEALQETSELFKLFGDYTRTRIICALVHSELCVCDIAELLGMSPSAVSHQLRIMRHMRVAKSRRQGRTVYYSIADEHIAKLLSIALEHISEEGQL